MTGKEGAEKMNAKITKLNFLFVVSSLLFLLKLAREEIVDKSVPFRLVQREHFRPAGLGNRGAMDAVEGDRLDNTQGVLCV
jgi:hypothetical protein